MNIKKVLLFHVFLLANTTIFGCELLKNIIFRRAIPEDASQILTLVETYTQDDKEKIYILPKKFRLEEIENSIKKGHTFVAYCPQKDIIVGYKKMFLINDEETLCHVKEEMGYSGEKPEHIDTAHFISNNNYSNRDTFKERLSLDLSIKDAHIYIDMDFTHPEYRGIGINKTLTQESFNVIKTDIIDYIKKNNSSKFVVSFGLSNKNDFPNQSRTPGIAQLTGKFAETLKTILFPNDCGLIAIIHNRYTTGMPLYDENSTENTPLDQSTWVPSSGNFLSILLQ